MKKTIIKLIIVWLVSLCSFPVNSQTILGGIGGGGGTFAMNSGKEYNQTVISLLAFNPEVTDNFPPWFVYKAELLYSFPRTLAAGLNISSTSTGSRLHLADYSGHYTFDNLQRVVNAGAKVLLGSAPGKKSGICGTLEGGMALSYMVLDEVFRLTDYPDEEYEDYHQNFTALGWYLQPGVTYQFFLTRHLQMAANAGYYIGFEKGYHLPGEPDQIIRNTRTNEIIKPEWNGLRLGVMLYWNFDWGKPDLHLAQKKN
jgi:hypothetical protein